MIKIVRTVCLLLLVSIVFVSCDSAESENIYYSNSSDENGQKLELSSEEQLVLDKINLFNQRLICQGFRETNCGSFCISPVALTIHLGALANAASELDRINILTVLGIDDIQTLNSLCKKLIRYLTNKNDDSFLVIDNCMWSDRRYAVSGYFKSVADRNFNFGIHEVELAAGSLIGDIEKWIDLAVGTSPSETVEKTLANNNEFFGGSSARFIGQWKDDFYVENSGLNNFHGLNDDEAVHMMKLLGNTKYLNGDIVEGVRLSFGNSRNVMDLYLPMTEMEFFGFLNFHSFVSPDEYEWSESRNVELSIPKFSCSTQIMGSELLASIGLGIKEGLDLSPIGLSNRTYNLIHPLEINVDENGVGATAKKTKSKTNGNDGSGINVGTEKITLNFNRPFFFFIRNTDTNLILLAGAVADL